MNDSGITVTYSGSDALLDSAAFSQLIGSFSHHLPLRNLHWKPSTSFSLSNIAAPSPFHSSLPHPTSIRTIQSLNVRLEPIADTLLRTRLKPETRHLIQRTLLERPFCHLYFVVCDDSDTYRSQIRNDIRSWLSTIQNSPTLSAATVTAKGFQGIEGLQHHKNGSSSSLNSSSTPRVGTPPIRPDTPTKDVSNEDSSSSSKEKQPPPSPEYLIVVVTPPEGSSLPLSATSKRASPASATTSLPSVRSPSETPMAAKSGPARFFSSSSSSKGSVIDKVKADFNTSRRERVVHLTRLPPLSSSSDKPSISGHSDPTIFADLQTRLKECVSATFDAVVEMQGEVVKREGQKRNVPGWNFCKWMAGMECVASTFEGVGLFSDALAQYEEIEAAFMQCLQERNLPFFSHVGGATPGDDSAPLLDITTKNYRDLILRNEITLFDFRSYVFAKRATLLGKLGRVSQVMNETPVFLSRVGTMLQGESLPRHFLESWTFSCSLDVVEQCQAWLVEKGDVSAPGQEYDVDEADRSTSRSIQRSEAFHSAKAELLDLARRQLDKIGIAVGHLPKAMPFSLSFPHSGPAMDRELPPLPEEVSQATKASKEASITRPELLSAIGDREVFDLHYTSLTERVLASWTSGGRRRNVLRLRCVLGSLDFYRERFSHAYSKFIALPEEYSEQGWSIIEASHLAKQLECHSRLGKTCDRAWVSVVVALLETFPQSSSFMTEKQSEDTSLRWLDPHFLYSQLREHTQELSQEIPLSRFDPVNILVKDQVARVAKGLSQDGTQITATVENRSSCSVEVDDIRVCLVNGAGKEMWFTSGKLKLNNGSNDVTLSCHLFSPPGKYMVDVSQIRLAKVIVQYLHRKAKESPRDANYVNVLEDGDALLVSMELSKQVQLDQSRTCTMSVWTGRNEMQRMVLRLMNKGSGTKVKGLLDATLEEDMGSQLITYTVNMREHELDFANLPAQTLVKLSIPLHEIQGAADGTLRFLAELDYYNQRKAAPSRKRQVRTDVSLFVGLPLGVNVQDFFRSDQLFSKFLISAGSGGLLRLGSVHLECEGVASKEDAPFEILHSIKKGDTVVTPSQAASYLFAIRKSKTKTAGPINRNLRLTLSYRTLLEEAIQMILYQLECVLVRQDESSKHISIAHQRCLERALTSYVTTQADLTILNRKERLYFAPRSEKQWKHIYRQWAGVQDAEEEDRIHKIVQDTITATQDEGGTGLQAGWRELSLVVDVPRMKIVNAVTVHLGERTRPVRIGQVVGAKISIETSFYWDEEGGEEEIEQQQEPITEVNKSEVKEERAHELNGYEIKEVITATEHDDDDDDDAASFQDALSEASHGGRSQNRSPLLLDKKELSPSIAKSSLPLPPPPIALSIDIQCDYVNWLLVGSKRVVITISPPILRGKLSEGGKNETAWSEVDFSLIAIKSGSICLPSVTIWPLADPIETTPPSHAHRDKESNAIQFEKEKKRMEQSRKMTCDSHITNEAETVTVLPALQGAERRTYWMNL